MRHTTLFVRFRSGVLWNAMGALFNQGSTLAVNVIVANLLGRAIFGQYAMVFATVATVATIAQFATGYTATKFIAEFRAREPERASRILGLCGTIALTMALSAAALLWFGARSVARDVLRVEQLTIPLQIASPIILLTILNSFLSGILAGVEAYRSLALAGVLAGSVYLAGGTVGAACGGLNGALVGLLLAYIVQSLALIAITRTKLAQHGLRFALAGATHERGVLIHFALPAALSGFSTLASSWLAAALLVRQPDGLSSVGSFTAANNLRTIALLLPMVANSVGLSILNAERSNPRRYRAVFIINFLFVTLSAATVATVSFTIGPTFMRVFGREFVASSQVLSVLMFAVIFEAITLAIYQVLQTESNIWISLLVVALPRDLTLLAAASRIRSGAIGLAKAYALAAAVGTACTTVAAWWLRRRGRLGATVNIVAASIAESRP